MSRVKHSIVAHPGLQAIVFVALVCLHIWRVDPVASDGARTLSVLFLTAIPICSNLLHWDRARDLGIRLDNLRDSGRLVVPATLVCSLLLVALGAAFRWRSTMDLGAGLGAVGYVGWGFSQQYALQGFVHRRLRESMGGGRRSAAVSALLFGIVHLPNPALVVAVTVAGYLWCRAYDRAPNLFMLAISHAWLATLLMTSVPVEIHHVMRIGPGYWG